jgi:manganese/zinc/iron transport system ATP- binding protein
MLRHRTTGETSYHVEVTAAQPSAALGGGLEIRDLVAGYGGEPTLSDVNLELPAGSITGVVGPNGSGKSTLLRAILGLTPHVSGDVRIHGVEADRARDRIAYVPQREVVDWGFPINAADVVMMGRYPRLGVVRRPRNDDRRRVADALARVGMEPYAGRQIGALSGGQQQRVFLARALAQGASVLLLDEPMTGVDRATEQAIDALLRELRDGGATVVITTHDLESAAEQCDLLAFVNHRLVAFGPPADTFTPATLHATFGGELLIVQAGDHRHVHAGGHHHGPDES